MTLRSLSKNVEILPESSKDSLVIRLSEAFSERMRGMCGPHPKAAAAHLRSYLREAEYAELCPICGRVIPPMARYCHFCGKAVEPLALKYERKRLGMMEEMEEMKEMKEMKEEEK